MRQHPARRPRAGLLDQKAASSTIVHNPADLARQPARTFQGVGSGWHGAKACCDCHLVDAGNGSFEQTASSRQCQHVRLGI